MWSFSWKIAGLEGLRRFKWLITWKQEKRSVLIFLELTIKTLADLTQLTV